MLNLGLSLVLELIFIISIFFIFPIGVINDDICIDTMNLIADSNINYIFLLIFIKKKHKPELNRKIILDYVFNNPGCILSDIKKHKNLPRGTIRYHIQQLENEGKIVIKRVGKYMMIFPAFPAINEKEKTLLSFVRNNNYRTLLSMLIKKEGATNHELSEKYKMDKSLTHRYLKTLLTNKIISSIDDGKIKRYYIEQEVKPLLLKHLSNNW